MQTDLEREQQFRFGGGGGTNLAPIALGVIVLAGILILVLPRKYVIVPLLLAAFFIPVQQQVVIAGLHFMLYRIVILLGWMRVMLKRSAKERGPKFRLNAIDGAQLAWCFFAALTFVLLWGEVGAVIKTFGLLYDSLGIYFLLRMLCRDSDDVHRYIKTYAVICAILALCMLNEQITGRNLFSILGGAPAYTVMREGKLRSQGAFGHPILAGTFCATLLPLFVGLVWRRRSHAIAILGAVAVTVGTVCSNSSTPLGAYIAGVIALCFWPLRNFMRAIRWGILLTLISLHMVMNGPVWALISHVDFVGGSSGDHRYQLVNQFIMHTKEWWLIGTKDNRSWGFEMSDTSNWYVGEGVNGGLPRLLCFIAVMVYGFKAVGKKRGRPVSAQQRKASWALGCALFSNLVAFFGISYFDQTIFMWYSLLAMISAATVAPRVEAKETTLVVEAGKQREMVWAGA